MVCESLAWADVTETRSGFAPLGIVAHLDCLMEYFGHCSHVDEYLMGSPLTKRSTWCSSWPEMRNACLLCRLAALHSWQTRDVYMNQRIGEVSATCSILLRSLVRQSTLRRS